MIALAVQIAFVASIALALACGPMRRLPAARHATLVCALLVIAAAPLWPRLAARVSWRGPVIGHIGGSAVAHDDDVVIVASVRANSPPPAAAIARPRPTSPIGDRVFGVWASGIAVLLSRLLYGVIAGSRLVRRAGPVQVVDGIPFRVSDDIAGPASVGVLRPIVLIPNALMKTLSPQQLRQVLTHERAHARRGDHLVVLLQRLVAAAWWPHPLVHLLGRVLDRAREERCDNDVVLAGHDRIDYARTLADVADWMSGRSFEPSSAGLAFISSNHLERRIAGLVDERRNLMTRAPLPLIGIALAVFAGAAVLLSCATGVGRAAEDRRAVNFVATPLPSSLPLYEIKFDLGDAEFADGDSITIEHVLCTGEKLGIGEIAIVRGKYTLASHETADLEFHVTAKSPNPTPVDPRQRLTVKKGSGTFELRHALWDGYPHISFNQGSAFGGVYFGVGDSVLKNKGWTFKENAADAAATKAALEFKAARDAEFQRALRQYHDEVKRALGGATSQPSATTTP